MDWVGIVLLAVPIFIPIIDNLNFDGLLGFSGVPSDKIRLWFGVLYLVNMQMSFLSPPFGYALFYIRGVAPKEISTATIFQAAFPFLFLQGLGLFLCIVYPEIVLYLPRLVYGFLGLWSCDYYPPITINKPLANSHTSKKSRSRSRVL